MSDARYLLATDDRGIATLTLNRPEVANAYDEDLLRGMTTVLETVGHDDAVRALVIRGAGRHFQAGADINWLNRLSRQGPQENYTASIVTVRFSKMLNELPKPTLAVIHGACFGGGVGIACCVDVALVTPDALFAISEVRHGIAPTPISTHMVNAIGLRQTRRYARRHPTAAEAVLWKLLRDRHLEGQKFRRQHPVGPFIADFACLELRLLVEADGGQHADSTADARRTAWLEAAGWRVVRFWNGEVLRDIEAVKERLVEEMAVCRRRHPHPPH